MKLKPVYDKKDDIPEALADLYIPKTVDGKDIFVLEGIEGDQSAAKVKEFRDNNIGLKQTVESLQGQLAMFDGVDPEQYKTMTAAFSGIKAEKEKALLAEGKLDEVLTLRVGAMKTDFEAQTAAQAKAVKDAQAENKALRSQLGTLKIDGAVTEALDSAKLKVRNGAMADVISRTRSTFSIDEKGEMSANGDKYGTDGNPLTVSEHITNLLDSAPHLFETGQGGGAGGAGQHTPNVTQIDGNDPLAMGRHLKDLAAGKVTLA